MPGLTSFATSSPISIFKSRGDSAITAKNTPAVEGRGWVIELCQFIVDEFFKHTGLSVRGFTLDLHGPDDTEVRSTVEGWTLGVPIQHVKKFIDTSIGMAMTAYSHTHVNTQVHIALLTFLLLCVDDSEIDSSALSGFALRLQTGTPQLHPVLDLLVERLRLMPEFFSPYATSAILSGIVHFINESAFEKQAEAVPLLDKRAKNGLSEVYSSCAWEKSNFPAASLYVQAIPDTMSFLDYSNDILSFYKEEIAGEKANLVHDLSNVLNKSIEEVLESVLDEVVHAVRRSREVLSGEQERATWERLLSGWVAFHLLSPRYRLAARTGSGYL